MTKDGAWVLASASPRRNEILRGLGLHFDIDPCRGPEPPRKPRETPARYVTRLARAKAGGVVARHPDSRVVAADTAVVVDDVIMGKPADRAEAEAMMRKLGGRWHEVLTGLCVTDVVARRTASCCTCSRVHFLRLSAAEISWYLDTGEYRDKAGGYGIQGFASLFIDRIEGCYFNVVGFPVSSFARLCRRLGIPLAGCPRS
ncbi:MAG: Maf family protein [Acidobacteriota bacterium]|nr:Maf family protein [Acidobacteriota bacterium]